MQPVSNLTFGVEILQPPHFRQVWSENSVAIFVMFQLCMGDGLPAQVCSHCVHQINMSYSFKLQCETSDVTLRKLLIHQQTQPDMKVCRTVFLVVKFASFMALTCRFLSYRIWHCTVWWIRMVSVLGEPADFIIRVEADLKIAAAGALEMLFPLQLTASQHWRQYSSYFLIICPMLLITISMTGWPLLTTAFWFTVIFLCKVDTCDQKHPV